MQQSHHIISNEGALIQVATVKNETKDIHRMKKSAHFPAHNFANPFNSAIGQFVRETFLIQKE